MSGRLLYDVVLVQRPDRLLALAALVPRDHEERGAKGRRRMTELSPAALEEARRVLRAAGRRMLLDRLDGDSVGAATGRHGGLGDRRPDERPPLGEGESVPVAGRNGDGRSRSPD